MLGVGHLKRIEIIADALADSQHNVTVISGGLTAPTFGNPRVNLVKLAGIKSDSSFSGLFDENGAPIDDAFKRNRITKIRHAVEAIKPDILIVETFPFGRRQLGFEIIPLIETAKTESNNAVKVLCSVRDIIQTISSSSKQEKIIELISNYFDHILVHGDPRLIDFEHSCGFCSSFKDKLVYTGYITRPAQAKSTPPVSANPSKTIMVSAGGGAVGHNLYRLSLDVAKSLEQERHNRYNWHILVGGNIDESDFIELQSQQTDNIIIERNRDDFPELLNHAAISISQGGYNTTMDILASDVRAIIVPFEGAGETEQLSRCRKLQQLNRVQMIREKHLSANSLRREIMTAINQLDDNQYPDLTSIIDLNGALNLARILDRLLSISKWPESLV